MRPFFSRFQVWRYLIAFTFAVFSVSGCQNWDLNPSNFPLVTTNENPVPETDNSSYIFSGSLDGLGSEETLVQFGHVLLAEEGTPSLDQYDYRSDGSGIGNQARFETSIPGLSPGQTYYFRAFAIVEGTSYYGSTYSFTVPDLPISLNILEITNIVTDPDGSSADVSYEVSGLPETENGLKVWGIGVTWSEQPDPDPRNNNFLTQGAITIPGPAQTFSISLLNLNPGSYYVRAFLQIGNTYYFSEESCFHIGGIWRKKSDLPVLEGLAGATSFSLNGKGFVLGGRNLSTKFAALWEYDPATDTWTQKKDFPGGKRAFMASFVIDSSAYAGLGVDALFGYPKSFFRYNPNEDNWYPIPNYPGSGREKSGAFSIDKKGYVGAGSNGGTIYADFWKYDALANQWSSVPSLSTGRVSPVAFSLGNIGYLGFGYYGNTDLSDFYRIQEGGIWVSLGTYPVVSAYSSPLVGTATTQRGYALGTFFENSFVDHFYEFDPVTDTWTVKTYIPMEGSQRSNGVLFAIDDKVYVGLGESYSVTYYSSVYEYTPEVGCN